MSESTQPPLEPVPPLDYGRRGSEDGFFAKVGGWLGERLNGVAEFVGMLIAMVGVSGKQLTFAIGLACLVAGYGGMSLGSYRGVFWMFVGAFLIGLVLPIPFRRK